MPHTNRIKPQHCHKFWVLQSKPTTTTTIPTPIPIPTTTTPSISNCISSFPSQFPSSTQTTLHLFLTSQFLRPFTSSTLLLFTLPSLLLLPKTSTNAKHPSSLQALPHLSKLQQPPLWPSSHHPIPSPWWIQVPSFFRLFSVFSALFIRLRSRRFFFLLFGFPTQVGAPFKPVL